MTHRAESPALHSPGQRPGYTRDTNLRPVRAKVYKPHCPSIMPQSLSKIYIHIIFHTKTTSPEVTDDDLPRLHGYIGQLINATGCINVWVGGTGNHTHALFLLSRETTISIVSEEIKRNSSRWIKTLDPLRYSHFEWQRGYAAYSVSQSVVGKTLDYIKNQKEHHKKVSFEDEYISFLNVYGIKYDERYVLHD